MFKFLRSYALHMVTVALASALSAAFLIYTLLAVQAPRGTWISFLLCIAFTVLAAFRVTREEGRKRQLIEQRQTEERREYTLSISGLKEEISDLEKRLAAALDTQQHTGAFVVLQFIDVAGLTNFVYHNTGKMDAYNVTLSAIVYGDLTVKAPAVHLSPGERKNVLIECEQVPEARTLLALLDHIQQTGFASIPEWAESGKIDVGIRISITFQDPNGKITATDWKIRRNLIALPISTRVTITPLGVRHL